MKMVKSIPRLFNSPVILIIAAAIFTAGFLWYQEFGKNFLVKTQNTVQVGKELPNFDLEDSGGKITQAAAYKGKGLILNVWSTWCPFCMEEMPKFQDIYSHNKEKLTVLGVHRTDTERRTKADEFLSQYQIGYPFVLDSEGKLYKALSQGSNAMPMTVYVDALGVVRIISLGHESNEQIEKNVSTITHE